MRFFRVVGPRVGSWLGWSVVRAPRSMMLLLGARCLLRSSGPDSSSGSSFGGSEYVNIGMGYRGLM